MKKRQRGKSVCMGLVAVGWVAGAATAGDFTWLSAPASALWNTTDANWSGAGSVWVNDAANNAAFGASGTRSITFDAVTVRDLVFSADGYALSGGALNMSGSLTVGASQTAVIAAPIEHADNSKVLGKFGAGTAVFSQGADTTNRIASLWTSEGTLQVAGGTTLVTMPDGNPEVNPAFWVRGGTLLMGGGVLRTTGGWYARVSDYGTLLVTNGYVDLTGNGELLNAFNSPGAVTVSGSGVLDVQQLRIAQGYNPGGKAVNVVNVNTGGTIRLNSFHIDPGTQPYGTVNFNGGTIVAKQAWAWLFGGWSEAWANIDAKVLAGGAIIDNNTLPVTFYNPLIGSPDDGGLTVRGGGMLYVRGANTYSGGTVLRGGHLNIVADNSLGVSPASPATNITFAASGTLQAGESHALAANRILFVTNGVTAVLDSQSYTQTIHGTIACAATDSTVRKVGGGTLVLDPGAAAVNTFGTLQQEGGTLVIASGTHLVTCPNDGQNAPGLRIPGGVLLVAGGVLKTTVGHFVNVDGGHLIITNGLADFTSCWELLNGIGSTYGYTTVSGSGVLEVNLLRISQNDGDPSNTVVNVDAGGRVRLGAFYIDINASQKGMLFLNGGTVEPRFDNADFLGTTDALVGNNNDRWLKNIFVHVREGGAIFDTAGKNISIKQPLYAGAAADGGLTKRGDGTLTLLNTNTYNGVTSVEAGTLRLGRDHALPPANRARVSLNAVFDVNGKSQTLAAIGGSGTISNGGALTVTDEVAPGDAGACGTLTLAATPAALNGVFRVDVTATGESDSLHVQGDLDLSGLSLSVADTGLLNRHERYTLATCTGTLLAPFAAAPLPTRWRVKYGSRVYLSYDFGALIILR